MGLAWWLGLWVGAFCEVGGSVISGVSGGWSGLRRWGEGDEGFC